MPSRRLRALLLDPLDRLPLVNFGTVATDLSCMSDSTSKASNERRRQPRVPCAVTVLFQAGDVCGHAHLTDMTPDGVCVRSALQPSEGDAVRIRFRFDTPDGQKVELTGSVVWSKDSEFGVRIDQNNYLSLLESRGSLD